MAKKASKPLPTRTRTITARDYVALQNRGAIRGWVWLDTAFGRYKVHAINPVDWIAHCHISDPAFPRIFYITPDTKLTYECLIDLG